MDDNTRKFIHDEYMGRSSLCGLSRTSGPVSLDSEKKAKQAKRENRIKRQEWNGGGD